MKKNLPVCIAALALLAALTIPLQTSAQQPRYKLIDLGTLGGPIGYGSISAGRQAQPLFDVVPSHWKGKQ